MKSTKFIAASLFILASCGGNTQKSTNVEEKEGIEQVKIEHDVQQQIDNLASDYSEIERTTLIAAMQEGRFQLSEEEKQVKPEYLMSPKSANDLVTPSQKYRSLAMLYADKITAQAYGQPTEEYDAAIKKLLVEINDPAIQKFFEKEDTDPASHTNNVKEFYKLENESERINFFWETSVAFLIEELYIISQNTDNEEFARNLTDTDAVNLTNRMKIANQAIEKLKDCASELNELWTDIQPIKNIDAQNVEQLKEQLTDMNAELEGIRNNLPM